MSVYIRQIPYVVNLLLSTQQTFMEHQLCSNYAPVAGDTKLSGTYILQRERESGKGITVVQRTKYPE